MSLYTSVLTAGTNSHTETSEHINGMATDFISPGVIGAITNTSGAAPMTGAFAVNAQGTPNMTVAVSSGFAWVNATPASQNNQNLRVQNTATPNVTISANSSGSTKYDWIYIQIDATKAANPAVDASDVASLVVSRSSSNTTDNGTPPTFGYCIAIVTVANGAASITNGNITDKRALATNTQKVNSNVLYNPYKFSAYLGTNQTITNNTDTVVSFDTVMFDTGSNFSTSTHKFTAPIAGFYQFNAFANMQGTGTYILGLQKNGSDYVRLSQLNASGNGAGSAFLQLAAGDTIAVYVFQNSGGNITLNASGTPAYITLFSGFLVSAT